MTFHYWGKPLEPFHHLYNLTHLNEREVELAVAFDWLGEQEGLRAGQFGRGLEVGNVLGHYGPWLGQRVVDRYETAAWYQGGEVENIDVMDIGGKYDWIISISTVEHVGRDYGAINKWGAVMAVAHLHTLLAEGGRMLITAPTGWNQELDRAIDCNTLGASLSCTLLKHPRRDGAIWEQSEQPAISPYGLLDAWASGVWFGEFTSGE